MSTQPEYAELERRLAQWLHWQMAVAQNLPYEEGDTCPDCDEAFKAALIPIITLFVEAREAGVRLAEAKKWQKQWNESIDHGVIDDDPSPWPENRIKALATALQNWKEGAK